MVEVFHRYRVHPAQIRAFEHAYGRTGPWAKLFQRGHGYKRTRLFRHRDDPGIYVTIDVWESEDDYDAFMRSFRTDYLELDRQLRMLKLEERLLGFYEGIEEYCRPDDTSGQPSW